MGTRRRRRSEEEESASSDGEDGGATTETKTAKTNGDEGVVVSGSSSHYEQIREQRMKENAERMQKLGLLKLSGNLKKTPTPRPSVKKISSLPSNESERRSSRYSIPFYYFHFISLISLFIACWCRVGVRHPLIRSVNVH